MLETLKFDLAAEVLHSFGHARLPVTGSSMFPCMRPGDVLEIRRPGRKIQIGDVVVFERYLKLVVHRVVESVDDLLITRGDRLLYADAPVCSSEILGCVTAIERRGRLIEPLQTSFGSLVSKALRHTEFGTCAAVYFARIIRL